MDFYADFQTRRYNGGDIHAHLPTLYNHAAIGDALVIELGVRGGDSTVTFLAAIMQHGGHLWSCDVNAPKHLDAWQAASEGRWTFELGDDIWAASRAPENVDVLFIDTSHTYAHTQAELELYADKVKPGGVILLHDTELQKPEASPDTDPPFPVLEAVTEFCDERGWELELIQGCYGLGIVHVPEDDDG